MKSAELTPGLRAAYLGLLERQFGLRAGRQAGQAAHLDGVVMQLLATSTYAEPADLFVALAAGRLPDVLEVLATSMTIGETHFFRVTPQIEALRRVVLPDLIARHQTDRRLRLWSAGCSTGEEPYTLAMLLREHLAKPEDWDIQLLATDLNRAALDVARLALYGEWSFRDSPPDLRARHFSAMARQWRLSDPVLRGMVRFQQHNLVEDAFPFAATDAGIDLIVCRNVTIYFGEQATQRLYGRFAEALRPTGWLLLGPSDPIPAPTSALEATALEGALVWRRRPAHHIPPPTVQPRSTVTTALAGDQPPLGSTRRTARKHQAVGGRAPMPKAPQANDQASRSMDPLVHLQVGMVRLGEGAPAAAIDSLRRAAFLDETSAMVQFSLGTAYRQLGDPSRSRSAFSRARRLLAGQADDAQVPGGDVVTGELRHVVESQLADLDRIGR